MTTTTLPARDESLDEMMSTGDSRDKNYFGQIVTSDDWDCALVKGAGKVPFDPAVHTNRLIAWNIEIQCTTRDGATYTLAQNDITSGVKHKITLASLKPLGISARSQLKALANKYCQVVYEPTGGSYVARKGPNAGQQMPERALKFVALFDTEEQCRAAEAAFYAPRNGNGQSAPAAPARNAPQSISANVDQAARAQLLATLPMLWQLSQQQIDPFLAMLGANKAYADAGIERWSDEVCAITGEIPF